MILPIGSDQARTRYPRLTIIIMVACFIVYFFTYWLRGAFGIMAYPVIKELEGIESELKLMYLEKKGEAEPVRTLMRIERNPFVALSFEKEFREAMEKGDVVPHGSRHYIRWEQAMERVEKARKRDLFYRLGYVPSDPGVLSLFTHMFLHANFWHWFFNMYFLWLVGLSLEDIWGRKYYAAIYLAGGMVAAFSHQLIFPLSDMPMIGASGAIAAMMGAYTVRFNHARLRFIFFKWDFWLRAWIPLLFWFGREVYYGISKWGEQTGIATWAHIGGYAFGAAAAYGLKRINAEDTFIARSLAAQDEKDRQRAEQKEQKKAGPPPRSPELEAGIEARKRGDLPEAISLLGQAIEKRPDDFEAREELIRILFGMGRQKDAASEIGGMIEQCLLKRFVDQALGWYAELSRQGLLADAAGPWMFALGQELERRSAWEGAMLNYRGFAEAVPDDPRAPKALFMTATILADKLGKPGAALPFYDYIIRRYPEWMPDQVRAARESASRKSAGS